MVQVDQTPAGSAALGGAGGAAFGLQAYRKGEVERQADIAAIANRARITNLAEQELTQKQQEFERTQQFRERLQSQREKHLEEQRTSGRNSALSQLNSLAGVASAEAGPDGLAPELTQDLDILKERIALPESDPNHIGPEDAGPAIQAWGIKTSSIIHRRAEDSLLGQLHNAQADLQKEAPSEPGAPDDAHGSIIDGWIEELNQPGNDPRRMAQIQQDLAELHKQHNLELSRQQFREGTIQKHGQTLQDLNGFGKSREYTAASGVLRALRRGEFQRADGTDDMDRFQRHFDAATHGNEIIDHPQYGEMEVTPAQHKAMIDKLTGDMNSPQARLESATKALGAFVKPFEDDPTLTDAENDARFARYQKYAKSAMQTFGINRMLGIEDAVEQPAVQPTAPAAGGVDLKAEWDKRTPEQQAQLRAEASAIKSPVAPDDEEPPEDTVPAGAYGPEPGKGMEPVPSDTEKAAQRVEKASGVTRKGIAKAAVTAAGEATGVGNVLRGAEGVARAKGLAAKLGAKAWGALKSLPADALNTLADILEEKPALKKASPEQLKELASAPSDGRESMIERILAKLKQ